MRKAMKKWKTECRGKEWRVKLQLCGVAIVAAIVALLYATPQISVAADVSDGKPIAEWHFDDGKGITALNSADNSSNGQLRLMDSAACWVDGHKGKALLFDGGNGYVNCGNSPAVNITDEISVEMWFYPKAYATGQDAFPLSKWQGSGGNCNYCMYFFGDVSSSYDYKRICFLGNAGGKWSRLSPAVTIPALDAWYHIVWTYSSTDGGKLYMNGELQGSVSVTGTLAINTGDLKMGGPGFNGILDEVRIYRRVLSDTEVSQHYKEISQNTVAAACRPISWEERRQWVEAIKPMPFWSQRDKIGYIADNGGIPTIMVDGKPMPVLTSYVGYAHAESYYERADRSYHDALCKAMTAGGMDYQCLHVPLYVMQRKVEWGWTRNVAKEFMKKNPNVRFFLRVSFIVDKGMFATEYPGNMTTFEDGTEDYWWEAGKKKERYSFASSHWERRASESLLQMLEELAKQPFADRVFAMKVTFGVTGEGGWWSEFNWGEHGIDYSPAMQDYFREYVKQKYGNNVTKLQAAWGEAVSFDNVHIPSMAERGIDMPTSCNEGTYRIPGNFGHFRDPQAQGSQRIIDFNMAMSNVMAERLNYFCEVIKRATDGKLLAGGLHSPPFCATLFHWAGSGGFEALLKSPYVDFDSTPWTYEGRALGEGLFFRGPADAMALRKKCLWMECDTRTSSVCEKQRKYGAPLDVQGDRENLRRDFIRLITSTANGYWYEINFPWFTEEEQREIIAEIGITAKRLTKLDRRRNADIAVIYDWDSIFYASEFVNFTSLCRQMLQEFVRIGADFDMYTIDDIGKPEVNNHKLFIFPNAIQLSDEQRGRISRHLKRDGKVLLWSYAPGLINPDAATKLSVAHSSDVTGMTLGFIMERLSPLMEVVKGNDRMNIKMPKDYQFGAQPRPVTTGPGYAVPEKPFIPEPIAVYPQFNVTDVGAKALGKYLDTGQTGYAVKRLKDWTSIYVGTYLISSCVLRDAAREAKVHLYLETDDIVYHNRSLLGIHTATAGRKIIRLPKRCDVYDIFENKLVGKSIDRFETTLEAGKTVLYFTGQEADIRKALRAEK